MKCVVKDGEVKRVSEERAAELVSKGWAFCPKKWWKAQVRDVVVVKPVEVVVPSTDVPVVEKKKKVQGRQTQKQLGEN